MSKIKKCVGKEGFQRMNYLLQISNLNAEEEYTKPSLVSMYYSNLMINVSKKTVQRIEPDIKRIICKHCRRILIAGVTCKVRINKKHVRWTCYVCGTAKNFKTDKDYEFWLDKPESIQETLNYSQNKNINS